MRGVIAAFENGVHAFKVLVDEFAEAHLAVAIGVVPFHELFRAAAASETVAHAVDAIAAHAAEAAAIVRRIGNPSLMTMLDTCSAGNGESDSVVALLERFVPTGVIAHVHFNDRNRRSPGQGKDRFGPVLDALRRTGYAGFAAVEPFDYLPDGPTSAARAIGYLRALEETLA